MSMGKTPELTISSEAAVLLESLDDWNPKDPVEMAIKNLVRRFKNLGLHKEENFHSHTSGINFCYKHFFLLLERRKAKLCATRFGV